MAPSPDLATSVNGDIVWESLSPASLRGVEVGEGKSPCEWPLALRRGTVSPIPSSTLGKWGDVEGLSWDGTVWGLHLGLLIPGEGQPGDTNHPNLPFGLRGKAGGGARVTAGQEHWSGLPFPSPMNESEKLK